MPACLLNFVASNEKTVDSLHTMPIFQFRWEATLWHLVTQESCLEDEQECASFPVKIYNTQCVAKVHISLL